MEHVQELINQYGWILNPVSDAILFLFTTKTGLLIVGTILFFWIILQIYIKVKIQKLLYESAKNNSNAQIPVFERTSIIFSEFFQIITRFFSNIPVLVGVLLLIAFLVGFSKGLNTLDDFIDNQKKIEELKTVYKHLNKRYKVAELEVIGIDNTQNTTSLKVTYFDYAGNGFTNNKQEITIKGHDIYFLSLVMNFDYSQIAEGKQTNLAIPYKIFSESVAKDDGIILHVTDSTGVPYFFKRNAEDLYGISMDDYNKRIYELSRLFTDKDKARALGVRSFYAAAPHYIKTLRTGQKIIIWIEQTGGMVIKEETDF